MSLLAPVQQPVERDALPIDPRALVDASPRERGQVYNGAELDYRQREAVEEALRMVKAGTYPGAAR